MIVAKQISCITSVASLRPIA